MRCVVCGSEAVLMRKRYNKHVLFPSIKPMVKNVISQLKGLLSRDPGIFNGYICICSYCGHGVMEKPPSDVELHQYYEEQYWQAKSAVVDDALVRTNDYKSNPRANHQVELVLNQIICQEITSVLEIGAGSAFASLFLRDRCRKSSPELYVCEPGHQWGSYYGDHGIKKIADYFPFETNRRFEYIHTSHWLEHVLELDGTLKELEKITNSSGYIFVEVPNTEHYYWDLPLIDMPHIQFFTSTSLVWSFEKHGFQCLSIGEYGITFQEQANGIPISPDRYGLCDKGFWIRALFRKVT